MCPCGAHTHLIKTVLLCSELYHSTTLVNDYYLLTYTLNPIMYLGTSRSIADKELILSETTSYDHA